MARTALVLGAGIVGVSVALHLRRRGWGVVLVDRQGPGEGASFGNGGLIQREAVYPHPFPRALAELQRIARNRAVDVAYHPLALPRIAAPLLRYWWHSAPERYVRAVLGHSRLIATCLDKHMVLAREAAATDLLRPIGWLQLYGTAAGFERALSKAEAARRDFGVNYVALDGPALAQAEPHLLEEKTGAIHWTDPYAVSDPHALTLAYARLFTTQGGVIATGDARGLQRSGSGWRVNDHGRTDGGRTGGGGARRRIDGGDAAIRLCAAALRQAGLPHALQLAGQRRAEPPAGRCRHRLRADADAAGDTPHDRR